MLDIYKEKANEGMNKQIEQLNKIKDMEISLNVSKSMVEEEMKGFISCAEEEKKKLEAELSNIQDKINESNNKKELIELKIGEKKETVFLLDREIKRKNKENIELKLENEILNTNNESLKESNERTKIELENIKKSVDLQK